MHASSITSRERFLREMFTAVDRQDTEAYGQYLTDEVTFTFGNAKPVIGRERVKETLTTFYASISSVQHDIHTLWPGEDGAAVEATVTYERTDGATVSVPAVTICRFDADEYVCDYRIFVDLAPLLTP